MIFGNIKTLDEFTHYINKVDDWMDLNMVRNTVLGWSKHQHPHALRHPETGFDAVLDELDKRATDLGFMIYSFGYRKPATPQP